MLITDTLKIGVLALGNFAANGPIGTAAVTVDILSNFVITQTTPGISITIPAPTDTQAGDSVYVGNSTTSTADITIAGILVSPGEFGHYVWSGTAWLANDGLVPTPVFDFWRSGAGATTLPDGTTDLTENIRRNGNVGLGIDPLNTLHVGPAAVANTAGIRLPITSASPVQVGGVLGVNAAGDIVKVSDGLKKFRVVQPLVVGNNTITHNLALVAPFAVNVETRNNISGAIITERVSAESANSFTLNVAVAVASARITVIG